VIDALLAETFLSVKQLAHGKSVSLSAYSCGQKLTVKSQNLFALLDSQRIRCHLVALGLDMLAAGTGISYVTAQRFQQHVAAVCALPWQEPSETFVDIVLPAILTVLDSPSQINFSPVSESGTSGKKRMALVGSLVVPAVIDFGGVLAGRSVLAQRCLLDILLVIFYKVSQTA
jgi:hypothetical protein